MKPKTPFMTVYELNNRLKAYDLNAEILRALKLTKKELIALNRAQLMRGRNANNVRIYPRYKTTRYAKLKRSMNTRPGYGVPDIYKEGNYQGKIDVKITMKDYVFFSRDQKAAMLEAKYPNLLGLTAGSIETYGEKTLMPILQDRLKQKLKNG